MRKSLTKAEILRDKADIAELFAKQNKFSRSSKASKVSKTSRPSKASPAQVIARTGSLRSRPESVSGMGKWPVAQTQPSLEVSERQSVSLHCQVDGLKLFLLLKCREQGLELLHAQKQNIAQMVFISPAKSLGNAVQRNRAKRLQREFYRHSKQKLQALALKIAQKKWGSAEEFASCNLASSQLNCDCYSYSYCHWGFVILRNASQVPKEQKKLNTKAEPNAKNKDFTESKTLEFCAELARYQSLIAKLEQSIDQTNKAS